MSGRAPQDASPQGATHWAQLRETTFATGIWFMYRVYFVLGRLPFLLILYPVVTYYWITHGAGRRASMDYLRRLQAAQGSLGRAPAWHHSLRHFLSFADTLLNKLLAASGRYRFERLRVEGAQQVHEMIERGQGGVFVTAHIGCLELCQASASRQTGMKLTVLVHTRNAERFTQVMKKLDPSGSVELIQVTEITPATAMLLNDKVSRGEFVAIAGDRIPVQGGRITKAPFLGASAPLPIGPYVLASLLKCPLLMLSCIREGRAYVVRVEMLAERIELPRARRDAVLAQHAAVYAGKVEALLARAPYEWFNFFFFWDQRPVAPRPEHHDSNVS